MERTPGFWTSQAAGFMHQRLVPVTRVLDALVSVDIRQVVSQPLRQARHGSLDKFAFHACEQLPFSNFFSQIAVPIEVKQSTHAVSGA